MTADEMFEELGYKKIVNDEDEEYYYKKIIGREQHVSSYMAIILEIMHQ